MIWDPALIIFAGSGVAIILVIAFKALEVKTGTLFIFPKTRNKFEAFLRRKIANSATTWERVKRQNIYSILHFLSSIGRWIIGKVDRRGHSKKLVGLVKGEKTLDAKGDASHFLHDVTNFRDKFRDR